MFGRKKDRNNKPLEVKSMKDITYTPKIIMAWTKSLEGNVDISKWLLENGYKELIMAGQNWLKAHKMDQLYHMALAIDGEKESWEWLGQYVTVDIFLLTKAIEKIKDSIEESHNDVHSFGKD